MGGTSSFGRHEEQTLGSIAILGECWLRITRLGTSTTYSSWTGLLTSNGSHESLKEGEHEFALRRGGVRPRHEFDDLFVTFEGLRRTSHSSREFDVTG